MDSTEVLRQFAKLLHGFADDILESIGAESAAATTQQTDTEPEQATEKQGTTTVDTESELKPESEGKKLTLEEVRPILAEKSRAGHTEAIRELIKKHGAPNLSGIDPAEYPALLAEVEAL